MDPPPSSKSRPRPNKMSSSASANSLHLSALPRFHPAAYSGPSSKSSTPSGLSASTSPNPSTPLSPKNALRFFDPAQRQHLSYYQQHLLQQSQTGNSSTSQAQKPQSPQLQPTAGSPGPVTPLALEDGADGYLTAGRKSPLNVDALIREEQKRMGELSPRKG